MTAVLESRLARLAEVLLHAERGVSPVPSGSARLRNRTRPAVRSSGTGTRARAGVAEQVAGIIESLHPDDLEVLVRRLEERRG